MTFIKTVWYHLSSSWERGIQLAVHVRHSNSDKRGHESDCPLSAIRPNALQMTGTKRKTASAVVSLNPIRQGVARRRWRKGK